MPIDYNSLKKITGENIIDGSVDYTDIANGAITDVKVTDNSIQTAKLGTGAVTEAKLASSAVDINGSKTTGTLPVSMGGTGLNTLGAYQTVLRTNSAGNGLEYSDTGIYGCSVYTGNSTWTRPTGVTRVRVQVVGGGGGGSGYGEAGGGGGYSERVLDVTGISSVSVTVGGGGGGTWYHNVGGGGGSSSFGPYCSAGGGEGARAVNGHCGGRPGGGSGGNINIYGGGGAGHTHHGGGSGGGSYFGGAPIGVHTNGPHTYDYEGWSSPGVGGTGAAQGHGRGAYGKHGIVVVWEYR